MGGWKMDFFVASLMLIAYVVLVAISMIYVGLGPGVLMALLLAMVMGPMCAIIIGMGQDKRRLSRAVKKWKEQRTSQES